MMPHSLLQLLMELSRHKNAQVLPLVKKYAGTRLPPDRYCLLTANCKLKTKKVREYNRITDVSDLMEKEGKLEAYSMKRVTAALISRLLGFRSLPNLICVKSDLKIF